MILAMCRKFLPGTKYGAGATPATDGRPLPPWGGGDTDLVDHRS
jgi:hypothetical protein